MIKVGFSSQVPQLPLFAVLLWSFPSMLWLQRPHSQSRPAPGVEVAFRSVYWGGWGSGEKVDLETRVCWSTGRPTVLSAALSTLSQVFHIFHTPHLQSPHRVMGSQDS